MLISLMILFNHACQSEANLIGGVTVSVLASNAVDDALAHISGEIENYKIGIFTFPLSTQHQ